ncbi:MAG: baseplate multidomain protein megatron [Alsobacter sp.]
MSTLVLQVAGQVVGTIVGGPIGGAIGQALGALAGSALDGAVLGALTPTRRVEGPRLATIAGLGSTEGAPVPRLYGRARLGGEVIWATRIREDVTWRKQRGGKGTSARPATVTTTYSYAANLAIGLCEGPIAFVRRVWADGRELDVTTLPMRVHRGTEDQEPDPLIVAKEGADAAPAYRGLAYVVFEGLPLAPYGNRIPQFSFEVVRPVGGVGERIRAVDLIPGAAEFAYAPTAVTRLAGLGGSTVENRHGLVQATDWQASLDALQALCPNLRSVGLVVSWFGDDLRAGRCRIAPRHEGSDRLHDGAGWSVAGLDRASANPVSRCGGAPAFGGTPADWTVVAAIRDLHARGLAVMLYPFVQMDVPESNGLPDPTTGIAPQPPFPWRGRITCDPAPGRPGSPDGTPACTAQVAALFGGPQDWGLRRMALHYAALAREAGGVEAFVLASEMVGITRLRSAPGVYPATAELVRLAAEVKAVLGPQAAVTYAADWTEYGAHVPAPGELRFPLDPLWASPSIAMVGLDAWWPVTDWRDGDAHADAARARSAADPAYLAAGQAGGEGFDWFYADDAARAAQIRTPITDGLGKPWAYRVKDLIGWWSNPHVERVGGRELPGPTAWVPRSKPIRLVETGCPAVDRGGNGPSAFPDPKSSEGRAPPFSSGRRDDAVQARAVAATLDWFAAPANNPVSPLYGGPMVDPLIHVWCWDARPFPAFPSDASAWADAAAWDTGHWLNGRLEGATLDRLVNAILADFAVPPANCALDGFVDGYVLDRPMSARAALEPLAALFGFDSAASGGRLRILDRTAADAVALTNDDLVPDRDGTLVERLRAQADELPSEVRVSFADGDADYARAVEASRRLAGGSRRESAVEAAIVLPRAVAARLAEGLLHEAWTGRESARLTLRPGLLGLEIGDAVRLPGAVSGPVFRITRIRDAAAREIEARAFEPAVRRSLPPALPRAASAAPPTPGAPFVAVIDWPSAVSDPPVLQSLAVAGHPWRGATLWRSADGASFDRFANAPVTAAVGRLAAPLLPGPVWRWDRASALLLALETGDLAADGDLAALSGRRLLAVTGPDGVVELVGFAWAELVAPSTWRLTRLLRGLGGAEATAARTTPAGSLVVVVDEALVPVATGAAALGRGWRWRIGPPDRDHGDPSMTALTATPGPEALRPPAPVRPSALRSADGITLRWIRRGRVDADAWEPAEIPLGEEAERYTVAVLGADGATRRSLDAAMPSVLYPAADEIRDFGAPQSSLALCVVEHAVAVAGRPLETVVRVR